MTNILKFLYCWFRKKVYFSKCKKKMNRVNRQYDRAKYEIKRNLFNS